MFQCVSIYSDVETKATALVDFCATFRSTPQMVCNRSTNNKHSSRNVRKRTVVHVRQQRPKSTCTSVHSDQSRHCPHEETLNRWLSKMRPAKILIRLCECVGLFESSLGKGKVSDVAVHFFFVVFVSPLTRDAL